MTRPASARVRRAVFRLRYQIEVVKRLVRRTRGGASEPRVAVVYVFPLVGQPEHDVNARRFVSTYCEFPPLHDHSLHVVFNGGAPSAENLAVFDGIEVQFHRHDNSGWDIGAFQMAAAAIDCDIVVCLGANSHFKRAGWLRRMVEAVRLHGDGLYGASASYERNPHVRTTAFWCDPMLIRAYPKKVVSYDDRYEFEASDSSITRLAEHIGLGCWTVTWEAEYPKKDWRTPPNIFRRGDQSNSLVFDRYFELYEAMDEEARARNAALADSGDFSDLEQSPGSAPRRWLRRVRRGAAATLLAAASSRQVRGQSNVQTDDGIVIFQESAAAHYWCRGKGIEIGAAAHNPFGLNTLNIDITEGGEGQSEQMRMCGEVAKVDIIAPGDRLPLEDESQDFVVSSHVLEHFPDPIAALLEWHRVTRPGGMIYMIVPHKERTFDKDRERTTLAHLIADHEHGAVSDDTWEHQHVWVTDDVVELVEWMAREMDVSWRVAEVLDTDDKVGNGFAIALVKAGALPPPWLRQAE